MIPHEIFIDFSRLQGSERVRAQRNIQEKLIRLGFHWSAGANVPKYLDKPYINFNAELWDRLALSYIGEGQRSPPFKGSVTFDAESEAGDALEAAELISRLGWWRN